MSVTHYQYDDVNKERAMQLLASVLKHGDYIIISRDKEHKHMTFMQGSNVGDNLLDYLQHLYIIVNKREEDKKYGSR